MVEIKYKAFTLVEMLIVMGILIILMAVGIVAGRFAINRANDISHKNAADQIYTALQSYYTDHREFVDGDNTPAELITDDNLLGSYMDNGAFQGGTAATYYYIVSDNHQIVLICVSKGGIEDDKELGIYCNGNGFGGTLSKENILKNFVSKAYAAEENIYYAMFVHSGPNFTSRDIEPSSSAYNYIIGYSIGNNFTTTSSNWDGNSWME